MIEVTDLTIYIFEKYTEIKRSSMEVIETNRGGIPTENLSTLIPTDLAAIKCPNSWIVTNTPRSITNAYNVVIIV